MANIKLVDNYWETSGIYDKVEGKTQREVNSDLKNTLDALIGAETGNVTGQTQDGIINATDGTLEETTLYVHSDYIPVKKGVKYYYTGRVYRYAGVAGFDSTKAYNANILSLASGSQTYTKEPLTIPDGVAYITATTLATYPLTIYAEYDNDSVLEIIASIGDIESIIGGDLADVTGTVSDGICDARTGEVEETSLYSMTDYISIEEGYCYFYTGRIYKYAGIAGFDSSKNYVAPMLILARGSKVFNRQLLVMPPEIKYIRANSQKSYGNPIVIKTTSSLSTIIEKIYSEDDKIASISDELSSFETEVDSRMYTTLSMFEKIGVCGDSFSSGGIYGITGVTDGKHMSVSWPVVLGRKCGSQIVNCSEPGINVRDYLTDANCLPALLASDKCGLYILALGINTEYPTGTADDIDLSDYTQNPDTFCGNYGRLFSQIKAFSPKSKFILYQMPVMSSAHREVIPSIAEKFGIPLIVYSEGDGGYYESDFYKNNRSTNHPIAVTYSGMANIIEKQINKCLMDNISYFRDYDGTGFDS